MGGSSSSLPCHSCCSCLLKRIPTPEVTMIAPRRLTIQEILFATDFSPDSHHAFQAALALAEHFGAKLHVLHVVDHESEQKTGLPKLQAFTQTRGGGAGGGRGRAP